MTKTEPLTTARVMEAMGDIFSFCDLLNFVPLDAQAEAFKKVQAGETEVCLSGGRGESGKTTASCLFLLWRSLHCQGGIQLAVCPIRKQCDVWMREAKQQAQKLPLLFDVSKSGIRVVPFGNEIRTCSFLGIDNGNVAGLHASKISVALEVNGAAGTRRIRDHLECMHLPADDFMLFLTDYNG